jgi:predicted dehydrogenase
MEKDKRFEKKILNMERKIRFGILGCGLFGVKTLIPAFSSSKDSELIAITKRDEGKARELAKLNNIPLYFSDFNRKSFLKSDIDAVFIATPNAHHLRDTIECLEAGKHVLLEKPMAMNKEECLMIIDKEKETGLKVMIAQCMRFTPVLNYFKNLIDSNKIGKLVSITADFMSTAMDSKRKWKFSRELAGGGAAFDLGVHMIDSIRYLAQSEIERIELITIPAKKQAGEIDLISTFTMRFKNQVIGRSTSSYFGPRTTTLEIYGEKGFARVYDWNLYPKSIEIHQLIEGKENKENIYNSDYYAIQIDEFSNAIKNNAPVPVPSIEGLKNQEIIDLVNQN